MDDVRLTFAVAEEEGRIMALLSAAGLPSEDILPHRQHFIVAKRNAEVAGCIGIEMSGQVGLLRSLAVATAYRNQGIGSILCDRLIAYAKEEGVEQLYLLTTTAAAYFERLGFQRIAREEAPLAIQSNKQFTTLCPSTAVCMKKRI